MYIYMYIYMAFVSITDTSSDTIASVWKATRFWQRKS